jgi:hypothetical protein
MKRSDPGAIHDNREMRSASDARARLSQHAHKGLEILLQHRASGTSSAAHDKVALPTRNTHHITAFHHSGDLKTCHIESHTIKISALHITPGNKDAPVPLLSLSSPRSSKQHTLPSHPALVQDGAHKPRRRVRVSRAVQGCRQRLGHLRTVQVQHAGLEK